MSERRFPVCVSPDHVMGLVEILNSVGGAADAERINEITDVDADLLPHAIDAAEILGLVKFNSGNLRLTGLGKKMAEGTIKYVKRELGDVIRDVEPFRSILRRLEVERMIEKGELMDQLKGYAYWEDQEDLEKVFSCLLSWLLYAQVAKYDWDEDVLLPNSVRTRHPRGHKATSSGDLA